jgi:hypothetical protein
VQFKVIVSVLATLVCAVVLVGGSGAGTTAARHATRVDVSTRSAVINYLRSIHVNPRGVVIQRGALNYAGTHCPGGRWTCASTKHTVVQIAQRGGQNRFMCRTSRCVVVQFSGALRGAYLSGRRFAAAPTKPAGNTAFCLKTGSGATTGSGQSCTISQAGSGPNLARVYENTQKVSGLLQTAQYTASITQTSTSGANTACVTQNINLDGSTTNTNGKPTTANLQAYQTITITQNSSTGDNNAAQSSDSSGNCTGGTITQSQTLSSTVSATGKVTQNQNAADNGPNLTLDIKQNQGSGFIGNSSVVGKNNASFTQTSSQTAIANSPAGANQTQTSPSGGILAAVNQYSKGLSTANAVQQETQCEDAQPSGLTTCDQNDPDAPSGYPLTQVQYGPAGLVGTANSRHARHFHSLRKAPGDSTQTGNANDTFTISQTSRQDNDKNSGQSNVIAGGIETDGTGLVTQNTVIQGTNKKNVHEGNDTNVQGNINCPTGGSSCTKNLSPPTITDTPDDPSAYGTDASFSFSNVDDTVVFVCSLDGSAFTSCTSPNDLGTGLASGSHTFSVKTKDPDNGNLSAASTFTWVITPPDPTITGSSKPTNPDFFGTSDTFAFTDADSSVHYKCKLDSGTATACNGGSITYNSAVLSPGSHTFSVRAFDATDTYPSDNADTYTWTILPLSVDALGTDGSAAGWACGAGGPIGLTLGTDTSNTFAEIDLIDAGGTAISDLTGTGPTFTTNNYAAGSPRYYITLDNGDSLWGYPANSELNGTDFAWAINNGTTYQPWADVRSAESGTTVTGASVIADGDQDAGVTDKIGSLQFNGATFNSGTCT